MCPSKIAQQKERQKYQKAGQTERITNLFAVSTEQGNTDAKRQKPNLLPGAAACPQGEKKLAVQQDRDVPQQPVWGE